jgi:cysteinyl-tRNA synthetase
VAPDRPIGLAPGTSGHGDATDPAPVETPLADRAHAPATPLSPAGQAFHERYVAAIDDDLDLPTALAVVREALRSDLPPDERRWLALDADFILGLDLDRVWELSPTDVPQDIQALVDERAEARARRDYGRADAIRMSLAERGWDVVDADDTSTARRRL